MKPGTSVLNDYFVYKSDHETLASNSENKTATLIRFMILVLVPFFASSQSSAADQQGFIARSTNLLSEANPASLKLASMTAGTEIVVLGRKGGWYQISTDAQTGWVKFINVRFQSGNSKGSSGLPEAALLLTQDTSPTLTAGVKGLQEEDLNKAEPNIEAVYQMGLYAVTREEAMKFARDAQLRGAL